MPDINYPQVLQHRYLVLDDVLHFFSQLHNAITFFFAVRESHLFQRTLASHSLWHTILIAALKHQGVRHGQSSARGVPKLQAREQVALDAGEGSRMAVTRYIALTRLIPPLLASVDEGKLPVSNAADYISGLAEQEQADLASVIDNESRYLISFFFLSWYGFIMRGASFLQFALLHRFLKLRTLPQSLAWYHPS